MDEILTEIAKIVLPIVATFVAGFIADIFLKIRTWIESKVSMDQIKFLETVVAEAINSAEKLGISGQIENVGKAKKEAAIHSIKHFLESKGMKKLANDIPTLEMMIESAINQGLHKLQQNK